MQIHVVSSNAGFTSTTAYVLDRGEAYANAEKRPVTVEAFDLPTHDMRGVAVTWRGESALLKPSAVSKITTA